MSRLGAHPDGGGVDFAVFSSVAEAVDLCLFDAAGSEERHPLEQAEGYVWTGRVEGAGHGQVRGGACWWAASTGANREPDQPDVSTS